VGISESVIQLKDDTHQLNTANTLLDNMKEFDMDCIYTIVEGENCLFCSF
jgi:hypothetical protein